MAFRAIPRSLLIGATLLVPPTAWTYRKVKQLEAKYPPCNPETTITTASLSPAAARSSAGYRLHSPEADVYSARVPARGLQTTTPDALKSSSPAPGSLEEAWARIFLESTLLRAEAQIVARSRAPGDCGEHGFHKGQKLLNALFEVQRPPAQGEPLLLSWTMAEDAVGFFRRVARWGYPWRLMSGGRHELGVGAVDEEGMVDVRFSAVHDYEVVEEEGARQKTIPEWVKRCHRLYAMWLLDERAEEVRKRAKATRDEEH